MRITYITILTFIFLITIADNAHSQKISYDDCRDKLLLKDGSVLIGQIASWQAGGALEFTTYNGITITVPHDRVRKLVQTCARSRQHLVSRDFSKPRWYHATRAGLLPELGSTESSIGLTFQHSSGIQINRYLGLGVGAGATQYGGYDCTPTTYPVYAEARGYLTTGYMALFYTVAGGYSFSERATEDCFSWGGSTEWRGGGHFNTRLGYLIGNHFTFEIGALLAGLSEKRQHRGGTTTNQMSIRRLDFSIGLFF